MAIELCLFDLDNTLLRTSDLEPFRGRDNVGVTSAVYTQKLREAAFGPNASKRHLYTAEQLIALRTRFPGMRWGVFTRSPRHYANTLLDFGYPEIKWDIVIGYEDVRNTKPHPDGIWIAARETDVDSVDKIALIGDEKVDVVCAFRAGCWSFIDQTTWEPRTSEHWWALERVPDALFRGADELANLLEAPLLGAPELEYLLANEELDGRRQRIDQINHFFPRFLGGGYVPIKIMGRLFGDHVDIQHRRNSHLLTQQIHALKEAATFPEIWVKAIQRFLNAETRAGGEVLVTVIPFKPGRKPRLESLLAQVEKSYRPPEISFRRPATVEFLADVLAFRNGAVSSHGHHLNADERFANVGENLYVKRPLDIKGKHVIVIDDVVTSGATLLWANRYLIQAGAKRVSCMSLSKAIGPN
ncbi:HAD hydrolase-like protein [Hydrogenophaga defluvii]|uniref:HAD hydrolase-like protein n=1 Tax=Hydrogenophaga defluvii TaxID=249410 RepID=A0ABW2S7U9_9BURK